MSTGSTQLNTTAASTESSLEGEPLSRKAQEDRCWEEYFGTTTDEPEVDPVVDERHPSQLIAAARIARTKVDFDDIVNGF